MPVVSNFLIQVNIVPFFVDKILQRQKTGCDPASGAEEHSPVIFYQKSDFFTFAPTIALSGSRHGRIFKPALRLSHYS